MSETSAISWTKSTINWWIGCTKVGPGCDRCYAEKLDATGRFGTPHWGPGVTRKRTSAGNWNEVRKWNKKAPNSEHAGIKGFWPVFSSSLSDFFDNEVPVQWRAEALALIDECQNLTFQIVTKRVGNVLKMIEEAADWHFDHGDRNVAGRLTDWYKHKIPPKNVWMIATVVDQQEADRDIPKLIEAPAFVRGLSIEPQISPVDLYAWIHPARDGYEYVDGTPVGYAAGAPDIHWVITGGESGAGARPYDLQWARHLVDLCKFAKVAVHVKQMGANPIDSGPYPADLGFKQRKGDDPSEWPVALRVREFPL